MGTTVNPLIAQLLYRNQLIAPGGQPETPQSQATADAQQQAGASPLHRTPGAIAQAVAPAATASPQPAMPPTGGSNPETASGASTTTPATPEEAVHGNLFGQQIPLSMEDYLKGYKPQHLQPEQYNGPGWGKRLLFGLAAAASGIGHPEIGYQMVSNYNNRNQDMAQEVADYNAKLPVLNQQADRAAYNQYLEDEATKARIADTGSQISSRGAQAGMQQDELTARLAGMGYRKNAQTGALEQIPENEMTPVQQAELQMTRAGIALRDAQTAAAKAETDPNSPQNQRILADLRMRQEQFASAQQHWQAQMAHQDAPINDYLAAHGLPNTPENRTQARAALTEAQAGARNAATAQAKQAALADGARAALNNMQALSKQDTPAANYAFLMNYIGMSYSGVRGARLNQAEIERAGATRTLPDQLQHWYDLAVGRKQLTPEQKQQMMDAAKAVVGTYQNPSGGGGTATPTVSMAQLQQVAKAHGVTLEQAKADAIAHGVQVVK